MPTQEASEKTALLMLDLGGVMQASLNKFSTALAGYAELCREEPERAAQAIEALGVEMQRLSDQLGQTLLEVSNIMMEPPPSQKRH